MSIACPHCGHRFDLKAASGAYQPACPDCHTTFVVVVPREPGQAVVVAKTVEALKAGHGRHGETGAHSGSAKPQATGMGDEMETVAGDAGADAGGDQERVAGGMNPPPPGMNADASEAVTVAGEPAVGFSVVDAEGSGTTDGDGNAASGESIGTLDGYELLKELGRGGMGCVYLARQVSLDRQVAVKTIHPALADDPAFLARFVREAFAVAQLSHHNVVQIHDVGQDEETHFFSMELVPGRSLADVVRQTGPLDPRAAAMYVLHAARGLGFAHEHRMVHRDVKPANLLLSDSGLVKVADLGLVKTEHTIDQAAARSGALSGTRGGSGVGSVSGTGPGAEAASAGASMTGAAKMLGTPTYMAPEQAADAAHVDARADIYALGGTLYYLVTGKPPYPGKTVREVIRNHRKMPLTPPTQHNPRIPAALSAFIEQMLEKHPAQRPQTMGQVIKTLEAMLQVQHGPFTPRPEHAKAIESAADQLRSAMPNKARRGLIIGFHGGCALLLVLGILASNLALVSSAAVLWVVANLTYQLAVGLMTKSELLRRCRRFALTVGWLQWVIAAGGAVSFSVMMVAIGLQWAYLGALGGGAILGVGFHLTIDRWTAGQQKRTLLPVRDMLSELRRHGVEEQSLRQFVCRYAGRRWEQLYEHLFGYDDKLEARRLWGYDDEGNARPRFAGYRDRVIAWLDGIEQQRTDEHRKHHLQRMEVRRLRAEGVQDVKALAEARQLARDFDDNAARYRATKRPKALAEAYHNAVFEDGVSNESLESVPDSWKLRPTPWTTRITYWIYGARGRFLLGSVILLGWLLWATSAMALPTLPHDGGTYLAHLRTFLAHHPDPLSIPGIPPALLAVLSTPGAMFAGLLLMASGLFRGIRMTFFLLPIVIMLLRAPFMSTHPGAYMSPLEWTFLIALALTPPGILFGRIDY